MIKIISGKHKGRMIPTDSVARYRPSTGKFREALFSILSSGEYGAKNILQNAEMLDLYCGTGSLSFEALSRGVPSVTLVDTEELYLNKARIFAEKIGEAANVNILRCSAINLPRANKQYNLIVMDPPYGKNLVGKTLKSLVAGGWIDDAALIAIETESRENFALEQNMEILLVKKYGNTNLSLVEYVKS
ncbi:MAG: RsmD family RNA methyltransferase [Rickettsiaceae bacterium]|nr:RsmD family RNA methyltransferase [Rickettsiaceae bacterium]